MRFWHFRAVRRARAALGPLLGATILSCARPAPQPRATNRDVAVVATAVPAIPGGRFVPLPNGAAVAAAHVPGSDVKHLLVAGLRLSEHSDGRLEAAAAFLPDRALRALALPGHLGGGYLFYTTAGGSSALWRASSWTSALEPLASLDFEIDEVVAGFDRLYVFDKRSGEAVAIDAQNGAGRELGPLPTAPNFVSMAFSDAWFGAVEVPHRGVLVTFDAGASWHVTGLGGAVSSLGEQIQVTASGARWSIDHAGAIRQLDVPSEPASGPPTAAPARTRGASKPLGVWPLRSAILYGYPESPQTALVLAGGTLARVRLSDGAVLAEKSSVAPETAVCTALPVGTTIGFVCHEDRSATSIYELEPAFGLRLAARFERARYVAASGNGGLLISGSCAANADRSAAGYCIRHRSGQLHELAIDGDAGSERVAVGRDGNSYVIVPPRKGRSGRLTRIGQDGAAAELPLRYGKLASPLVELLHTGLWLHGFTERAEGEFSGWVVGSAAYVGVRVARDGSVRVGVPGKNISTALLAGEFALEVLASGNGQETKDGGFTWNPIDLPPALEVGKFAASTPEADVQGCSAVGCAVAGFLRVGWWGKRDRQVLPTAVDPERSAWPVAQGGRWSLSCAPAGESVAASEPNAAEESPATAANRGRAAAEWSAFEGVPGPEHDLGMRELSYTLPSPIVRLRAYAWGPDGPNWQRLARWQVRVSDRFRLRDRVWSTAASRLPWPDFVTAEQTFGKAESGSAYVFWSAMLDPERSGGVVLVKARGTSELHVIEESRSIVSISGGESASVGELGGAVKVGNHWYVGGQGKPQAFQIFRVDGDKLTLFTEYSEKLRPNTNDGLIVRVVRSVDGSRLGLWVNAQRTRGVRTSWYVYPVDLRSGELLDPLHLDPARLGRVPDACEQGVEGWMLQGQLPVQPYVSMAGGADAIRTSNFELTLLADSTGNLCVETMTASAEPLAPKLKAPAMDVSAWAAGKPTISLILRTPTERTRLRCIR